MNKVLLLTVVGIVFGVFAWKFMDGTTVAFIFGFCVCSVTYELLGPHMEEM